MILNILTMQYNFLGYRGLKGTHMDGLKPSGIFGTKLLDLADVRKKQPTLCSEMLKTLQKPLDIFFIFFRWTKYIS